MQYCLNPSCVHPDNPDSNKYCQGCNSELALSSQSYNFRQRYRVVKILEEKTYQAEDLHSMGKPCIIQKGIFPGIARQQIQKLFLAEAEKIYNLNHPQIPQIYDYFVSDNAIYLVQELITGETLLQELKQEGVFEEKKILEILAELLPVLQYIHNNGVIHGGIKKENILRSLATEKLNLIKFSIGKQTISTRETDISSLGATCVSLLSEGDGRERISDRLNKILEKMLIPHNYLSAEAVIQDLNHQGIYQQLNTAIISRQRFVRFSCYASISLVSTFIVRNVTKPKLKTFTYEVVTVNYGGEEINRKTKEAEYFTAKLGQETTIDLVLIPGGRFLMGSSTAAPERDMDETPQHWVKIEPFYLGKYPVTQAQWEAVMGSNPSYFRGSSLPVESISWLEAVKFCKKMSEMINRTCRLPSEAEWEYACRARTITSFHFGETLTVQLANYRGISSHVSPLSQTTEVGSFLPNGFGLYDMHGNVREWCADAWYDSYLGAPETGNVRKGDNNNKYRVIRGCSWFDQLKSCRSANRGSTDVENVSDMLGVRVVVI